jgi:Family of unknown function (DUF6399)
MPVDQPTVPDPSRQDPFRWPHTDIRNALEDFANPDPPSQREFAQQFGIPHATFNYWLRHHSPDAADRVDSFFRSPSGEAVLRRIVLAALATFCLQGACGIRLVGAFLQRAEIDRFVACSRGALHPLAAHIEADLVAFRDSEQPPLAQQMKPKTITVIPDEHFHSGKPCLVGLEPVSGFLLVECYRDHRDADTWTEAIQEGIRGMSVEVTQLTSDLARALVCCAEKGLHAAHSPDLFHGQRDLMQPLVLPLNRPVQQAEKELEKAAQHVNKLNPPPGEPLPEQKLNALIDAVCQEAVAREQLAEAKERKEETVQQVRGVSDDYHPFDRETGKPLPAEEVGKRLARHLDQLEEVVQEAALGGKAKEAVTKARTWVQTLMGCVAWFWGLADARMEELDVSEEVELVVKEKLLAGHYWAMAAGRARTAEERARLKEMAEKLKKEAWQEGGALASLSEEKRKEVEAVAHEVAGLFQRSSSCVEGRNGRLSLQHHGHSRVSERRLKALTVIHNYVIQRTDGTTAAHRFFGQQHKDVFSWLLERMPDLPRPAQKRRQSAA